MGVIATGCHHITEDLFLLSAQAVADHVKDEHLEVGSVYPPLGTIRECSIDIAVRIAEYAYAKSKNLIISQFFCNFQKYFNTFMYVYTFDISYFLAGLASEYPEPKDKREFIVSKMYDANYDSPLPNVYDWPGDYAKPRVLPDK